MMKKWSALALILAVVLVAAGCNLMQVNSQRDETQVVAVVNGEKILKSEVNQQVGFSYDKTYSSTDLKTLYTNMETALENLISDAVVLQTAKDKGMYDFTEEELAAIQTKYDSYVTDTYNSSLKTYQEKADNGEDIDPEAKANEDVDNYLKLLGTTRDELMQTLKDGSAAQKLYDSVTESATVTEEQISEAYSSQLSTQQTSYGTSPTQVITDMMKDSVICYRPAEIRQVKQVLIGLDSATVSAITSLRNSGDTDGANAKLYEALATIQGEADEVMAKVKAGEDFDKLIEQYNDDTGMSSYPDGYPTMEGYTGYYASFQDAAMALKSVGDTTTELVYSDYGYHILKFNGVLDAGAVDFEDVKDQISEQLLNTAKNSLWSTQLNEMKSAAKIKRYTSRLR
ncbi:MAG: peptidylprolyl isomerase [Eubacteriales bacterium]|nr:peptidylprolyl isomerase [Eubacteriales bacterium]